MILIEKSGCTVASHFVRLAMAALPMTFLLACGNGGAAVMTGMATTPPVATSTVTPPTVSDPQSLPPYLITDLAAARTTAEGRAPVELSYSDIITELRARATDADTLQFASVQEDEWALGEIMIPDCMGTSCTVNIPDIGEATFSLVEIYDPSIINDGSLDGYNAQVEAVMVDEEVMLVQGISAARGEGGTPFTFQTYAGWLDSSVFGLGILSVTEGSDTIRRLTSYSFGSASGSNPTAIASETSATWRGVAVGYMRNRSEIVEGNAVVDIEDLSSPRVDVEIRLGTPRRAVVHYQQVPLTGGNFERDTTGTGWTHVKGSFYGENHEEVGGFFTNVNYYGAFGAKRQ